MYCYIKLNLYICKVDKAQNKKNRVMKAQLLKTTIKNQTTSMLKTVAKQLINDFSEEGAIAFVFVLNELENRLTENDFVHFTDSL